MLKKLFSEKKNNFITNSFHNYGFKKIGKKFEVLGMSKDGSIEFAKVKKFKTYCMMFHPERYNIDQSSIDKLIKKIFLI